MKKITAAVVAVNALLASVMGFAQSNQGSNLVLEEIVITAQRRQESAQDAALSIDVLGGDDVRAAGIASPDDLTRLTPGLQISGGTTTQIYIRGVGDFGVTATANPGVATSLDGVAIARPQAISGNLFDLQRVEVLKGPQGTLYGRNATGGAINLISKAPILGENSGFVELDVGNYSQAGLEGAINVSSSESFAMRLSFDVNDRDGYLSDGGDDDERESFRLQGLYSDDNLSVKALLSSTDLGGNGSGLVVLNPPSPLNERTGNTDPLAGEAYLAAAGMQFQYALAGGCNPAPPPEGNCPPSPYILGNPADSHLFRDVQTVNAQVQIDYDLDWATLTLIPSYRTMDARFLVQPSFSYNVGGTYSFTGAESDGETSDQYSFEARLSGETDKMKWVVGGFYFTEDQTTDFTLQGGLILNQRVIGELSTESQAIFGQVTFDISDDFRLTGGVRYTEDDRTSDSLRKLGISPTVSAPSPVTGLPPIPCLPDVPYPGANVPGELCPLVNPDPHFYDSQVSFNEVTWKVGFEYDVAEDSLLFADVSTGFKAGGFNQAVSLTDPTGLQPFEPEDITSYTLGIKNRFMDNRLQFNMEAFYWDYKNLQLSAQGIDGVGLTVLLTQNAGEATVQGVNFDIVAVPWADATISLNMEYIDAEYNEYEITQLAMFAPPGRTGCEQTYNAMGLVTVDCAGKPLIRTPELSGNIGFAQDFQMDNGASVVFNADVSFSSEYYIHTDFRAEHEVDSYANLSASLTYLAADEKWYVSAYARNISDETIYTGGGGHQSGFIQGWTSTSIAPPRTYGVRLGYNF